MESTTGNCKFPSRYERRPSPLPPALGLNLGTVQWESFRNLPVAAFGIIVKAKISYISDTQQHINIKLVLGSHCVHRDTTIILHPWESSRTKPFATGTRKAKITSRMSPFKGDQQLYGMSFCDDECSSNDDTGVPMEKSTTRTAVSTPPRSACATASRRKELFGGGNANTPKSRRLFDDDDDDTDVVIERSTAPFAAAGRRTTTKPRDPVDGANNNGIVLNDACTEDSPSSSTLSGSSSASVPGGGRKRCSAERREGGTPVPPPQRGEDIATSMYTSPRISPNSFLTMDGRFVQSKNPFSSPMMMDTPTTLEQQPVLFGTCGTAPSLPESFYGSSHLDASANDTDADARMRFLPPRHHHHPSMLLQPKQNPGTPVTEATAGLRAFSIAPAAGNSGTASYPELSRPYGFACSPIPEDIPTTATNSFNNMMMMMPMDSTDTASSGSLHKVRRIHRSDDVVAATGHHLSNFSRRVTDHPIVHTAFSDNMMDDDGISPTDVLNFPAFHATPAVPKWGPPPTPVKQRPSQQPYSSCHNSRRPQLPPRTPGPPLLARKTGVRTPHHNPSSHYDQSEETPGAMATNNGGDAQIGSSRFHADFDVIGELGHGSFGTVYKVLSRLDGCMYAIKEALRQAKGMADRDRMLKEVRCVNT